MDLSLVRNHLLCVRRLACLTVATSHARGILILAEQRQKRLPMEVGGGREGILRHKL